MDSTIIDIESALELSSALYCDYIYVYNDGSVNICVYISVIICNMYMYVCMFVCMDVCMHIYMYVYGDGNVNMYVFNHSSVNIIAV